LSILCTEDCVLDNLINISIISPSMLEREEHWLLKEFLLDARKGYGYCALNVINILFGSKEKYWENKWEPQDKSN